MLDVSVHLKTITETPSLAVFSEGYQDVHVGVILCGINSLVNSDKRSYVRWLLT